MKLRIGVKSDPVEYRYSYEWLFSLLQNEGVEFLQLGSSFEFYLVDDRYFTALRELAEDHGVSIRSCFTAHRELGGAFTGDPYLEDVARRAYARYVEIGALLGADYVGSNPGAVYRDRMHTKEQGTECYLNHMKEMMGFAKSKGVMGLTVEPMSCSAEPPTTPLEIARYMSELAAYHHARPDTTVPVHLCGDISHGFADAQRRVIHGNAELFKIGIPHMVEFHFKNTDDHFESTFGFSHDECKRGIVDLHELKDLIFDNTARWPVAEVTGYLEIGGPKLGRDYSDRDLGRSLVDSLAALRSVFGSF
jgi:sugar phosphate isomerase/epimerase